MVPNYTKLRNVASAGNNSLVQLKNKKWLNARKNSHHFDFKELDGGLSN